MQAGQNRRALVARIFLIKISLLPGTKAASPAYFANIRI